MAFFWYLIVILALTMYVVLDGYDLGIGILTLFQRDWRDQRLMLAVVGNVWDGNESWIVLLAMGLWGGTPDAYATILPGLYIPLFVMIFALIFRGFSIEMTLQRSGAFDRLWGRFFGIGSLVAAFAQGVVFGGLVSGIVVRHQLFAGSSWDFWGRGYSVLTGLVTVGLFTLAGATRLLGKVGGPLRDRMVPITKRLTLIVVVGAALAAGLLPVVTSGHLYLSQTPRWLFFVYAILFAGGGFLVTYRRAGKTPDSLPFLGVVAAEVAGMIALLTLFYPQIAPPSVTLNSAQSNHDSLLFLIIIIGVFGPVTVAYHSFANWVFRGRQEPAGGEGEAGGGLSPPTTPPTPAATAASEGGH
jgi:cytochrome bd ubiquinol oxidase subunit II